MSRAESRGLVIDGRATYAAGTHYTIIPVHGYTWITIAWARYTIADGSAISVAPGVGVSTSLNLYATAAAPAWLNDLGVGKLAAPNELLPARNLPDYPHWYQPPGLTFGAAIPLAADTREGGFVTITDNDNTHIALELVVPGTFGGLYVHVFQSATM